MFTFVKIHRCFFFLTVRGDSANVFLFVGTVC